MPLVCGRHGALESVDTSFLLGSGMFVCRYLFGTAWAYRVSSPTFEAMSRGPEKVLSDAKWGHQMLMFFSACGFG